MTIETRWLRAWRNGCQGGVELGDPARGVVCTLAVTSSTTSRLVNVLGGEAERVRGSTSFVGVDTSRVCEGDWRRTQGKFPARRLALSRRPWERSSDFLPVLLAGICTKLCQFYPSHNTSTRRVRTWLTLRVPRAYATLEFDLDSGDLGVGASVSTVPGQTNPHVHLLVGLQIQSDKDGSILWT